MNTNYWSPDMDQNLSFDGSNRVVPRITFHGSNTSTNLPFLGTSQIPVQYQSIHTAHSMNFNAHSFPTLNQPTTPILPAVYPHIYHPLPANTDDYTQPNTVMIQSIPRMGGCSYSNHPPCKEPREIRLEKARLHLRTPIKKAFETNEEKVKRLEKFRFHMALRTA